MSSNPFINTLLFGVGKSQVTAGYIEQMKPYMYTEDRKTLPPQPLIQNEESLVSLPILTNDSVEKVSTRLIKDPTKRSLFWSIFISVYEYSEYMEAERRAGNREIEEKLRIVEKLKHTPKILKESSSKLTIEQTQALYGSMLTVREDRIEFCAAYAAFYKKTIFIIYPKTYRVFSPTTEISFDPDQTIIVWASAGQKHTFIYSLDQESDIRDLVLNRITILKSQSNYKNPELIELANKMGIVLQPKPKKSEVYDALRLAIHKDMNFET